MDGLFSPPPMISGLLGAEEAERLRKQSIGTGIVSALIGGLAAAPNYRYTGIAPILGQALQSGFQGMQGTYTSAIENYMDMQKIAEMQRQQREREMQMQRTQAQRDVLQNLFRTETVQPEAVDVQGRIGAGDVPAPIQRTVFDPMALQQAAMLSADPLSALSQAAKTTQELRQAGLAGGMAQMENPFEAFMNSPVQSVQKAAQRYSKSFASGTMTPDVADKRVNDLASLEERAVGREESLRARQEAQQANLQLRQELAQQTAGQREQMLAMQREAQEDRRLAREIAQQEKTEAKETKRISLTSQAKTVLGKVDEAMGRVSSFTAGVGGLLSAVPNTNARNLQADLDTIKANLGFQQLQAMRDSSPTGGALGQVTERELGFLQSTVASLDQMQSPDQLRKALGQIKVHYNNWLDAVNKSKQGQEAAPTRRYNPATGRVE